MLSHICVNNQLALAFFISLTEGSRNVQKSPVANANLQPGSSSKIRKQQKSVENRNSSYNCAKLATIAIGSGSVWNQCVSGVFLLVYIYPFGDFIKVQSVQFQSSNKPVCVFVCARACSAPLPSSTSSHHIVSVSELEISHESDKLSRGSLLG